MGLKATALSSSVSVLQVTYLQHQSLCINWAVNNSRIFFMLTSCKKTGIGILYWMLNSRHANSCAHFPAMDYEIFPVTELTSPSLSTTIFSNIFNLLSASTYDYTSSQAIPAQSSSHCSSTTSMQTCSPSTLISLSIHSSTLNPTLAPRVCIIFSPQLEAIGRLESVCAVYNFTSCRNHRGSETCSDTEQTQEL